MKPVDFFVLAVLLLILGLAVYCIRKAKKKGQKCIGCPYSGSCHSACDHRKK